MKKLSYFLSVLALLLFSVSLQAQTSTCTKAEMEACKKTCTKAEMEACKKTCTKAEMKACKKLGEGVSQTGSMNWLVGIPVACNPQTASNTSESGLGKTVSKTTHAHSPANGNPSKGIGVVGICPPGCKPVNCKPSDCKSKSGTKAAVKKM